MAASVGPYGAALADGSEYRGDYGLTVAQLRAWHRPRLAVLATAGADVLAIETIPCLAEVEALLAEVAGTGVPCWLSLTCASPATTRAGEPVAEAFAMARDVAEVIAVGVNCLPPADAGPLVATAAQTAEQARRGLPQQRRGLGRSGQVLARHRFAAGRRGSRLGRRRGSARRWLLPGHPRGDRPLAVEL